VLELHRSRRTAAENRGDYWAIARPRERTCTREHPVPVGFSALGGLQTEPLTEAPSPKSSCEAHASVVPGYHMTSTEFGL
jgi:hypothetical protein